MHPETPERVWAGAEVRFVRRQNSSAFTCKPDGSSAWTVLLGQAWNSHSPSGLRAHGSSVVRPLPSGPTVGRAPPLLSQLWGHSLLMGDTCPPSRGMPSFCPVCVASVQPVSVPTKVPDGFQTGLLLRRLSAAPRCSFQNVLSRVPQCGQAENSPDPRVLVSFS